MKYFLLLIIFMFSPHSLACSFAPMIDEFKIEDVEAPVPAKPTFVVKSINRGFYDGNHGSCSDAGSISLEVSDTKPDNVGYLFKIVEGSFEDRIFYDVPVTPSEFAERNQFTFIWFDGHSDEQEPIDIVVEITPVSKSGAKGEPAYLHVVHPGTKKPWWKFW